MLFGRHGPSSGLCLQPSCLDKWKQQLLGQEVLLGQGRSAKPQFAAHVIYQEPATVQDPTLHTEDFLQHLF